MILRVVLPKGPRMNAWREEALCAGSDVDFYPSPSDVKGIARAQAVCRRCPVQRDCDAFAEAQGEVWGVWAGVQRQSTRIGVQGLPRRARMLSDVERAWLRENVG